MASDEPGAVHFRIPRMSLTIPI